MPTISASASSQITIPAGQRLRFLIGGAGVGQLAAANGFDGQFILGPAEQMIGPFPSDRVFRVSCTQAVTYQLQAPPFDAYLSTGNQVVSQDASGNFYAAGSSLTALTSLVSGAGNFAKTLAGQFGYPLSLIDTSNISLWNDLAGAGVTASVDSAVRFNGQPTIRLDIPAAFSGVCRIGTSAATVRVPYNWDRKEFAFAIMSTNLSAVDGSSGIYFGDAGFANFFSSGGSAGNQPQMQFAANQWMVFKPDITDWASTGSPTMAAGMRLRVNFNVTSSASATSVWIGGLFVMPKRPKPTVLCQFDDGFASHYNFVAPLFRRYRIPCSFAVCAGLWGGGNYLTSAQAKALHFDASGLFELNNHNYAHQNPNQYGSAAAYVTDVERNRVALQGIGVDSQ
ncbi:MAG: polysaccharide deacetylase family protein, partial [Betaproteobacteria bacterium]|nr:polysaccharide deacetylase family protein [Betaproteobacteria bacterium]